MTNLAHLERQLARLRDQHAILGARRPTPAELAGQDDADKAMARRIHQARPGVPPQHVLAVLHALRAVQEMEPEPAPAAGQAAEAEKTTRVIALYEQWVKAGPPPLGTQIARWWDKRLAELHGALPSTDGQAKEQQR